MRRFRPPPRGAPGRALLLDVGCGDGAVTRSLGKLPGLGRAIGMDVQPEVLQQAREAARAAREEGRVDFVEASATDVEFFRRLNAAGRVRCVTCFTTLHWLREPVHAQELAVLNFARVLAQGGQLFLVHFLGLDDAFMQIEAEAARGFLGAGWRGEGKAYELLFPAAPYAQRLQHFRGLFEVAGLDVEEARLAEGRFPIDADQVLVFLRECSQYISEVPEAQHGAYLHYWHREILERCEVVSTSGTFDLGTQAIVAVLEKRQDPPDSFYDLLVSHCHHGGALFQELLPRFGNEHRGS